MDILGKKGEEASEEVQAVIEAVEDLNSHLNALDNAVQHHDQEIDQVVDALTSEERISEHVEANAEDVQALKKVFRRFATIQSDYMENVDVLDTELDETNTNLSRLESKITKLKNGQDALFEEIEGLKDKINEMENEFIVDSNSQEWDIESKVSESEFEDREKKVDREIARLRTSLNDLSDKVDEEEIELEEP